MFLHDTRHPIHLRGSCFPDSGTPLIGETGTCRSVHRCGVCMGLPIHGVLTEIWNGCGRPAIDVGMRLAGLWEFGVDELPEVT